MERTIQQNGITCQKNGKEVYDMREEYDFSKGIKNPYTKKGKKQISINIAESSIDYFKEESQETGIPYQVLIDLYLADCVKSGSKLELAWK